MIDDTEQRRDENRDATTDRDDLLGRGVRLDPLLPPMTSAQGAGDAAVPSEESDQRQAVRELDRAHGRDLTAES